MLINLVKKCLIQANKNKMASIAFSSIGTGTLQFPLDVVARVYFDQAIEFSKKHPSTTLKDIRFVPFDKDIPIVRAFADELSKRTPQAPGIKSFGGARRRETTFQKESSIFSAVKERTTDHPLCFQVQAGNITNETTDAIVVVTNSFLNLSLEGETGAAILRAGGDSIQDECSRRGTRLPGSVVVTRAGRLSAKSIFHIVPPQTVTPNSMEAVVTKCLQVADRNGITSISFPAIGTGNLGMDAKECAEVLLASVAKFSQQRPKSIQLIRVLIFQPSMIKAFRSVMKVKSGEKERSEPGIFAQLTNLFFGREQETNPNEVSASSPPAKMSLEVFAGSRTDLEGACKAINNMMNEHCKRQVINNDTIKVLSEDQLRRIHTAELRYDTKVEIEKKVGRIEIRGNSGDILSVVGQIHEILDEVREEERERDRAEMLAKEVEWELEDNGIFQTFPSHINAYIESAYAAKKLGVSVYVGEGTFTIDFANMKIRGPAGNVTEIRRRDLKNGKTSTDKLDSPSHETKLLRLCVNANGKKDERRA